MTSPLKQSRLLDCDVTARFHRANCVLRNKPITAGACGCTNVTQDELQTLRNESTDLVRERDRLKEDISTLETSCSDKSGEIERLNSQLETTSAELKVKNVTFISY